MKVKSKREVHIRAFEAYRRVDNLKGILKPGFELEVKEVKGEYVEDGSGLIKIASDIWYKDKNGDFYWSGGFEGKSDEAKTPVNNDNINFFEIIEKAFDKTTKKLLSTINYNELLDFPLEFKKTQGKNITVGLLDYPIKRWDNVFNNRLLNDDFNINVIHGDHGTQLASIIGASYNSDKSFVGIAPGCSLLQLPILHKHNGVKIELSKIRDYIIGNYPNGNLIINASIKYSENDITQEIIDFYEELSHKYLVVASAGEGVELEANILQFPSSLENIIAVGAVSQAYLENLKTLNFNTRLDLVLKDFQYIGVTCEGENSYNSISNDSAATAIVTGTLSLVASSIGDGFFRMSKTEILSLLGNGISIMSQSINNNRLQIINPRL